MNAYSKDLRLKVLSAIDRGIPRKEVADLFGVSLIYHQALAQEKTPYGGRRNPQDPWQTICERQGLEGVAARALGGQR
jgi:hypothetical protein